jgi:hypothetical protein
MLIVEDDRDIANLIHHLVKPDTPRNGRSGSQVLDRVSQRRPTS